MWEVLDFALHFSPFKLQDQSMKITFTLSLASCKGKFLSQLYPYPQFYTNTKALEGNTF